MSILHDNPNAAHNYQDDNAPNADHILPESSLTYHCHEETVCNQITWLAKSESRSQNSRRGKHVPNPRKPGQDVVDEKNNSDGFFQTFEIDAQKLYRCDSGLWQKHALLASQLLIWYFLVIRVMWELHAWQMQMLLLKTISLTTLAYLSERHFG